MNNRYEYASMAAVPIGDEREVHFAHCTVRFTVAAVAPYQRSDGRQSAILTWTCTCTTCKREIRFTRGLSGRLDIHRCDDCITKRRRIAYRSRFNRPFGWRGEAVPRSGRSEATRRGRGPAPEGKSGEGPSSPAVFGEGGISHILTQVNPLEVKK